MILFYIFSIQERDGLQGCIPLTLCLHSGLTQFLAVSDADGYDPGTIFYPVHSETTSNKRFIDAFISGKQ